MPKPTEHHLHPDHPDHPSKHEKKVHPADVWVCQDCGSTNVVRQERQEDDDEPVLPIPDPDPAVGGGAAETGLAPGGVVKDGGGA